ncbi:MAG: DUF4293 domain-containing protein [Rikenellaceae bacterium]
MIQRIQTLYLLAAVALMVIFSLSTFALFIAPDQIYTMSAMGLEMHDGTMMYRLPHLIIVAALASLLPLVNIFFFKKRMLQVRLCVVQIVLTVGVLAIAGVYYYLGNRTLGVGAGGDSTLRIVCALPFVAMFFDYLALKAIFKDELLVKSLDRIR